MKNASTYITLLIFTNVCYTQTEILWNSYFTDSFKHFSSFCIDKLQNMITIIIIMLLASFSKVLFRKNISFYIFPSLNTKYLILHNSIRLQSFDLQKLHHYKDLEISDNQICQWPLIYKKGDFMQGMDFYECLLHTN